MSEQRKKESIPNASNNATAQHRDTSIMVRVKLFAIYQEVIQASELEMQLPLDSPVSVVRDRLLEQYPTLQPWRDLTQFGVNLEQATADRLLMDGDEVVLIPPVSGG